MKLSKQLFQSKFSVPDKWESISSYKLFEVCGFVEFPYAGIPSFLPIGKRVMDNISSIIREEAEKSGFSEVYLPLIDTSNELE